MGHTADTDTRRAGELRSKLLSGGAWALGGKALTALAGIAINALLARILTPDEMGAYFVTFSFVVVLTIFAQMGMNHTVVRLISESAGSGNASHARGSLRLVFTAATAAVIAIGLFLLLMGKTLTSVFNGLDSVAGLMSIIALWVAAVSFEGLLAESFRGFHDIRLASIFGGLVRSCLSAFIFAVLWVVEGHSSIKEVLVYSVAAGFTSAVIAALMLRKKISVLEPEKAPPLNYVFGIAIPLFLTNITFMALAQADVLILGAYRPSHEVAVYGAAARLVALVLTPLLIVHAVVPPIIAQLHTQGRTEELEKMLRATATIACIPAMAILIVFIFFPAPILSAIYGGYYAEGSTALIVLSIGQIVTVWTGSCGLVLLMTGHQNAATISAVLSAALTLAASFLLVRPYGSIGVASALVSGTILNNVVMTVYALKKVKVKTYVSLSPSYIISGARKLILTRFGG